MIKTTLSSRSHTSAHVSRRIESRKEKGRRGKKRKCKDKYSNHRTIPILCITLSLPDTARNKKTRTDRMEIERNEKRKENKKRKKNEKEKNPKAITKKEGQGRKKKKINQIKISTRPPTRNDAILEKARVTSIIPAISHASPAASDTPCIAGVLSLREVSLRVCVDEFSRARQPASRRDWRIEVSAGGR